MRLIQLRDQPRRSGNDPQSDGDLRTTSLGSESKSAYRASVRTNPALSMMNRPTKASTLRAGEIAAYTPSGPARIPRRLLLLQLIFR